MWYVARTNAMFRAAFLAGLLLGLPFALVACGGGSGGSAPVQEPPAIGALAYMVTDWHEDATRASASQRLEVLHGDGPPVTVAEIPTAQFQRSALARSTVHSALARSPCLSLDFSGWG